MYDYDIMKNQWRRTSFMTDWDSKTNKLIIEPFDKAIGEIFLYDGSFRIALNQDTWEDKKLQKMVKQLITDKLKNSIKTEVTDGISKENQA